jgi:hypothetical protein
MRIAVPSLAPSRPCMQGKPALGAVLHASVQGTHLLVILTRNASVGCCLLGCCCCNNVTAQCINASSFLMIGARAYRLTTGVSKSKYVPGLAVQQRAYVEQYTFPQKLEACLVTAPWQIAQDPVTRPTHEWTGTRKLAFEQCTVRQGARATTCSNHVQRHRSSTHMSIVLTLLI